MDTDRYRTARSHNVPASIAANWARTPLLTPTGEGASRGGILTDTITLMWAGWEVRIRWTYDEAPNLSYRGEFRDAPKNDGARKLHDGRDSGRYQYFEPTTPAREHRASLNRSGYSKQVAEEMGQRYVSEDQRAAEGEAFLPCVLVATVEQHEVLLAELAFGGVELSEEWPTVEDVVEYLSIDTTLLDDVTDTARARVDQIRA